MTDNIYEQIDR